METAPSGGAGMGCYADSVDSMSPRSRGGESWDEPFPSSAAAQANSASSKLRLMCSYGGHIMPRPHDKTLCYLGGETRIVVVDRHSTLADLHARLSRTLLGGCPFSLKYQLPSEDLDSLISVTTDEDFDNMVDEYDRVSSSSSSGAGGNPSRLRLFLFPAQPESAGPSSSSIGSLLDDSKSETWFVDALNGAVLGRNLSSADSAASSVNCLLGLDDLNPSPNGTGPSAAVPPDPDHGALFPRQDSSVGKPGGGGSRHGGQDVQSVPDSPKASSFGSASSTPFLSNLPPIRVRPDDHRGIDLRALRAGLDDQFSQMNVSGEHKPPPQQQLDAAEGFNPHLQYYSSPPLTSAAAAAGTIPANISPTENPNPSRVFSSDDDKSDHGGLHRSPTQQSKEQQQQAQQQQQPNLVDVSILGDAVSRPGYYQERVLPASSDPKQEAPPADPGSRLPLHVTEQGYLVQQPPPPPLPSMQTVEQLQQQQQQHQQQHQQQQQSQQQFIQAMEQLQQHQQQQQQQTQQQFIQAMEQLQQQQQQQTQQTQQQFIQANPHLVHHHPATGTAIPMTSYYQMPMPPQQQLPKAAHPYNPQVPMYFLPVRQNPAYNLAVQPGFGDTAAAAPIPSTGKPTIPIPSGVFPSRVAPHKPELAANVYRGGVRAGTTASSVVQPPQSTQLIRLADQPSQYVSYHPMHQHPSQTAAAATYGYEYADAVHAQQLYYTQATSTAMPPQYQTFSSGAAMAESLPATQQPTNDVRQTRAS